MNRRKKKKNSTSTKRLYRVYNKTLKYVHFIIFKILSHQILEPETLLSPDFGAERLCRQSLEWVAAPEAFLKINETAQVHFIYPVDIIHIYMNGRLSYISINCALLYNLRVRS